MLVAREQLVIAIVVVVMVAVLTAITSLVAIIAIISTIARAFLTIHTEYTTTIHTSHNPSDHTPAPLQHHDYLAVRLAPCSALSGCVIITTTNESRNSTNDMMILG